MLGQASAISITSRWHLPPSVSKQKLRKGSPFYCLMRSYRTETKMFLVLSKAEKVVNETGVATMTTSRNDELRSE